MKQVKTKCDHCEKPLPFDKIEQTEWLTYCSQECEQAADKEMFAHFGKQLNKGNR